MPERSNGTVCKTVKPAVQIRPSPPLLLNDLGHLTHFFSHYFRGALGVRLKVSIFLSFTFSYFTLVSYSYFHLFFKIFNGLHYDYKRALKYSIYQGQSNSSGFTIETFKTLDCSYKFGLVLES